MLRTYSKLSVKRRLFEGRRNQVVIPGGWSLLLKYGWIRIAVVFLTTLVVVWFRVERLSGSRVDSLFERDCFIRMHPGIILA